jgi:hypothetical protein
MSLTLNNTNFEVEGLFESELGFLMLRLFNPITKAYLTYNLGKYNPAENILTWKILFNGDLKNEVYSNDMQGSGTPCETNN